VTITAGAVVNVQLSATATAAATIDLARPVLLNLTKNGL
jgi:hypothetical protein